MYGHHRYQLISVHHPSWVPYVHFPAHSVGHNPKTVVYGYLQTSRLEGEIFNEIATREEMVELQEPLDRGNWLQLQ
jgi:hypothetical protein